MKAARPYQIFPRLRRGRLLVWSSLSIGIFLLAWYILSVTGLVSPVILPSPWKVLQRGIRIIQEGYTGTSVWSHLWVSMVRVFGSLFLACLTAIPLGIVVATNDYVKATVDPFVEFYRPLPPLAYLPLVVIWFGIGETSKMVLIFLAIFAPIFLNTRAGVQAIPKERIHAALCLGASKMQLLTKVVFPSALYSILTGIRIGLGFGWTTLVAAEMVAATKGVGHMILTASNYLQTDVVLFGIFLIGVVAYFSDYLMRIAIRKLVHWHI